MPKKLRPVISVVLLVLAIAIGVYYLIEHRSLLTQLTRTPLQVSIAVFGLYIVMFGVLILILNASIRICRRKLGRRENLLLNAHTLLINFFMPGQGGPAYRGIYLYKRHNLRAKNYIVVTLLYYAFYAVVSVFLLFIGNRPWWQTTLALVLAGAVGAFVVRKYVRKIQLKKDALDLNFATISALFLVTVLQAIVQITIYAVELHSVNSHIALSQIITYTGAANLALFVALTPGAIGIRESFLIFTEHLHHISSANIIVANVIDRSVFITFLLVLLAITIVMQVHGRLRLKRLPELIKENIEPASSTSSTAKKTTISSTHSSD